MSNLRQVGLAVHNHHDAQKSFPRGGIYDQDGNGLHGWQLFLLPYLDQQPVFSRVDRELPWHHPKNARYFQVVVEPFVLHDPKATRDVEGFALSHIAANVHVFNKGPGLRMPRDFKDGTSNTILMGEAVGNYKPWGHHANWRDPAEGIQNGPDSFGSPIYPDVAHVLMGDCSTRPLSKNVSPEVLKALSTPSGGEKLPDDWDK